MAKDPKLAKQVSVDFTKADLSPRERRIAEFAVKVSRCPDSCSPDDIDTLRATGLTDRDILGLVQIIAYYNMSNRFFEALSTVDP